MNSDQRNLEQFGRLFLDEIGAAALLEDDSSVHFFEDLAEEIRELRRAVSDTKTSDSALLAAAFGVVDTYVSLKWSAIMKAAETEYTKGETEK